MGMVMLYTDHPASEYWKTLVRKEDGDAHTKASICGPGRDHPRLRDALLHYLGSDRERLRRRPEGSQTARRKEAETLIGSVAEYAIRDWSCDPFGAGCHAWRPGVQSLPIRQRLPAFALEHANERVKNVHICGEAYSDYQGFIEGALQTALDVVEKIDGKCPVCD
jgi:Flavin containing amine oxidoreductase